MSANEDDIRVRIAGDLADINKALQELRRETRAAGKEARDSGRDWNLLGRGLDGLKRQVLGLAGAYFSFRSVTALFRAVIQNTSEAERVSAQLEARVRSTGQAAGFTAEQLLQTAREFQRVTTFGDEAIASMQSVLLTFTNLRGEQFTAATAAILDMAAALGTDLNSAATQVGRALNDPVKGLQALQRAGISLSSSQRALVQQLVETNQVAAAQEIILDSLQTKFGGAATAARSTFAGALAAVGNAFGDLFEGGGAGVSSATDALNNLVDVLSDPETIAAFQTLTSVILGVVSALTQMAAAVINNVSRAVSDIDTILNGSELDNILRKLRAIQEQIEALQAADRAGALGGNRFLLDRARAELAALEAQRDALLPTSRRPLSPGERAGIDAENRSAGPVVIEVDPREALKQLQAALTAARVLLDDEIKRVGAALERDFEENLVRFSEYFNRRAELERRAIDQELEQRRAALQLLDAEIKLAAERDEETETAENNRRKLVAEITALERQRGDVAVDAANRQADAERDLARQLEAVRTRLLELQGDTVGARQLELQREFEELLERLAVEGDAAGTELVNRLINVELARTRLTELQQDYERTLADLARAERRVSIEVETGVISEREGRRRIIELHRETAAEIEKLLPLMRELAAATGDPEAVERIKEIELELEELGKTAKVAAREMATTFRDAGEGALADFISGTRNASDAWDDFVDNIRRKAAELISERIFDKLFESFRSDSPNSSSTGGFFKSLFAAFFHAGGIVGLGGKRMRVPVWAFADAPRLHDGAVAGLGPNELPAILERGEEVLSRRDPRNRLNGGAGDTINLTVEAQDARSFSRASRGQLAADAATMLQRARNRNG